MNSNNLMVDSTSTMATSNAETDEVLFILKPEFIISMIVVVLVFFACVGLVLYRIITRRRREASYYESGINSESVLQVFGISSTRKVKSSNINNEADDEETIPLSNSYYHHKSSTDDSSGNILKEGFSNLIQKYKNNNLNRQITDYVSLYQKKVLGHIDLMYQVRTVLRPTDYELIEKKESLKDFVTSYFQLLLTLNASSYKTLAYCQTIKNRGSKNIHFDDNSSSNSANSSTNFVTLPQSNSSQSNTAVGVNFGLMVYTNCSSQSVVMINDATMRRSFIQLMSNIGNLSPYIMPVSHIDFSLGQGRCYSLFNLSHNTVGTLSQLIETLRRENTMDPDIISQFSGQILCALKSLSQIGFEYTHISSKNILIEKSNNENGVHYHCKLTSLEDQFLLFARNSFNNNARTILESFGYLLFEMCTGVCVRQPTEIYIETIIYPSFKKIIKDIFPTSVGNIENISTTGKIDEPTIVSIDSLIKHDAIYCDPAALSSLQNQVQMGTGLKTLIEKLQHHSKLASKKML
ncbi:predicted protein [Naegleria gruberi]|uniref:Predicted protein n=1 Tax=Naegleria gruberi TaxID=5762 RepID=D2VAS4_NAEGR|nr:uncharacterized protein NAEGRDRAFT_65959 [Naegleria gruberi]EFC46131.1 predicted protein [Naegleria gruberi]|eukprot:XP_002678875.1 predicted protein [Naegleria gruberi strain NEG-M]